MKKQKSNPSNVASAHTEIKLSSGGTIRIEAVNPHVLRFRLAGDGHFVEPGVIRYGIFPEAAARGSTQTTRRDGKTIIRTGGASLEIEEADGAFAFFDANGKRLARSASAPRSESRQGFRAELAIGPREKFYGLGDECRDRLNKRGHAALMWIKNITCYIPIPFVMSTGGWALLVTSTWKHTIDIGQAHPDRLRFAGDFLDKGYGNLDFYLIAGESLPLLLDRYTHLTGRPALPPKWVYGFMFINSDWEGARDVLDNGLFFRDRKIPCDSLGLEPGWMSQSYDLTVDKKWHPDRFPIPSWVKQKEHTFLGAMERMGYKLSIWLCCNYDLTWAEEKTAPVREAPTTFSPDVAIEDARLAPAQYRLDNFTKPDQPWFEHLKKFIDQGVDAFKMDAYATVFEYPDRKWANGMDDLEIHNIYGLLMDKQMYNGFAEHTGKRPMINSPIGYSGLQQYVTSWAGDTGGGEKPLVCILNHGLSGNPNVSCDMDVNSRDGIHFGFFNPWCMVNNFNSWYQPWYLGEELEAMVRFYSQLRSRLVPYIYSTAYATHLTGMPIARPMPLAFPDDPKSDELLKQFMFGDAFLIAAFTDKVHLPAGSWFDLWTGRRYEGARDIICEVPSNRGGPALVRAGAIIPYGPVMSHVDQKPLEQVELRVYPEGTSRFILFEDDGLTFGYREGQRALTEIECETAPKTVRLTVSPRKGSYATMPKKRDFEVVLHVKRPPRRVTVNQTEIPSGTDSGWRYEEADRIMRLKISEDPDRQKPVKIEATF